MKAEGAGLEVRKQLLCKILESSAKDKNDEVVRRTEWCKYGDFAMKLLHSLCKCTLWRLDLTTV
jgi:hypothetical protein